MLTDLGYEVIEAGSASEALAYLDYDPHMSAVLTDHTMLGMTGVEWSRTIAEKAKGAFVLLISGYGDAEKIPSDQMRLAKLFLQSGLVAGLAANLLHLPEASPKAGALGMQRPAAPASSTKHSAFAKAVLEPEAHPSQCFRYFVRSMLWRENRVLI